MKSTEFLTSFEELVEMPAGSLKGPEKLEDLEGWNSMAMIGFIALADENGVRLSPRQITASETVSDLMELAKVEV